MRVHVFHKPKGVKIAPFEIWVDNPQKMNIINLAEKIENKVNEMNLERAKKEFPRLKRIIVTNLEFDPCFLRKEEKKQLFSTWVWGNARNKSLFEISGGSNLSIF